jgi:hypothetical protein
MTSSPADYSIDYSIKYFFVRVRMRSIIDKEIEFIQSGEMREKVGIICSLQWGIIFFLPGNTAPISLRPESRLVVSCFII